MSSLGIFEYNQDLDIHNQGSQLISQMIWYFLEGVKSRKHELNPNIDLITSDCGLPITNPADFNYQEDESVSGILTF